MFPVPEDFDFEKNYVFIAGDEDLLFQVIMILPNHFNYVDSNYLTLTYQLDKPINEVVRPANPEEVEASKRL
ncbi:hypothetical protein AZH07_RS02275 [Acinetobacter baumannii]|nr:hypothetical protein [Acinetobacter baumannii]